VIYGVTHMKHYIRVFLTLATIAVVLHVDTAWAQAAGDVVAGQPSPWRHAHFVIIAYGVVWGGIAIYVLRLGTLARRMSSELTALSRLASEDAS
jgi:CcmD family protein